MNGIIVPPYNVLKKGFEMLKNKGRGDIPSKKILKSWFRESNRLSYKFFYLKDCSQYFTGYGIKKNYSIDLSDFKGYKQHGFMDISGSAELVYNCTGTQR
jgi:hypothetical protein